MQNNFNKEISIDDIPEYVAGSNIDEVRKKYKIKKVIKLASNENSYGVPGYVIKSLKKNLKNIFRYPDKEYKELKIGIADKIGVSGENIILGNGTDEIIDLVFKYKINSSSKVLLFKPSFSLYKILVNIYSARPVEIPLGNNFEYNIEEVINNLKKHNIDLLILCNPNNPTGTYINNNNLNRIIESLDEKTLLLIDEAYLHYTTASDFPDAVELFRKFENKKNLIITRTFSKIYSLAGLRIGYGIANKELIEILDRIRLPFNINTLANIAACVSLQNDKFIRICKTRNYQNKIFLYEQLRKMNLKYIKSEANFVLIKLPQKANNIYQRLLEQGIIVRPIIDEGMENYIRVTIGTRKEIKKFLSALQKILK